MEAINFPLRGDLGTILETTIQSFSGDIDFNATVLLPPVPI